MGDFAIVAEGRTDQVVLGHILLGFFEELDEEPQINHEQPPSDATSGARPPPGGWSLVVDYFKRRKFLGALQFNRYLVVHVDTDVVDDLGVPRVRDGRALEPMEVRAAVVARFRELTGEEVFAAHGHRFLFAIAMDSIECWLLPLIFDPSQKQKRSKTAGCLKAANDELRRTNRTLLSAADGGDKNLDVYFRLSREYTKRRILDKHLGASPSLAAFVEELRAVAIADR